MNSALSLLLHLLKLARIDRSAPTGLVPVSAEDLAMEVFGSLLDQHEIQRLTTLLAQVASGSESMASIMTSVNELAALINAHPARSESIDQRIEAANRALETVQRLRFMTNSAAIESIVLQPEDMTIFHYIETWQVEPVAGAPAVILVGTPRESADILVGLQHANNQHKPIEQKTEIMYTSASDNPRLNIKVPSKRRMSDFANRRNDWPQKPFAEHDLEVYSYQQRVIGSIRTRSLDLPHKIEGKTLTITLPRQPNAWLMRTSIADAEATVLTHCVRIVAPSPLVSLP